MAKEAGIHRIIRKLRSLHTLDVVFLAGLAAVVGVFLYFRTAKRSEWIPATIIIAPEEIWWGTSGAQPWYESDLAAGQVSYNTFGAKVAEVTGIRNTDTGGAKRMVELSVKLKVNYDQRRQVYLYNYQPLSIGSALNLTFGKQNVRGLVTFIGDDQPVVYKTVEVKVFAVYPWIANALTKGLESKDTNGRTVVRIDDAAISEASDYQFSDTSGRLFVISGVDPTKRDVTMTITLATKQYHGITYTLDGGVVKIGNSIHLEFPEITAHFAEVVRIVK